MPTTTGSHPLTYTTEGSVNWFTIAQTYHQAISSYFDDIGTTRIDQLNDANGNELIVSTATASAVNHFGMVNAVTGSGPTLKVIGDDTNIDFNITAKGTGKVKISGLSYPTSDGAANQALTTNGSGVLSWSTIFSNIVEDTTPQLGGSLDVNGNGITSSGDIPITLGDALGANSLLIKDSGAVTVASINSDGDISCTDITAATLTTTGAVDANTLKIASGTAITAFKDEDNMASDSATAICSQQSVKAYVDSAIASGVSLVAYLYFNAATPAIIDDLNVDTLTDHATGQFTINFTASTFTSADYVATAHARDPVIGHLTAVCGSSSDTRTTSGYRIRIRYEQGGSSGDVDANEVNLMFIGGQN